MPRQDNMTALKETIAKRLSGLIGIWVYGSVAKGEDTSKSDLDIAVLANAPVPFDKLLDLSVSLMQQVGCDVDFVDLRVAPSVLRKEVIAKGRRIYCADWAACETFEDFVFSDYARLNEERAGILDDIFQRGSVYG